VLFRLGRKRPDLSEFPPVQGPLVSVIIPARDEVETIETVVRSVLATTYRQIEVIVVDDRSTDGTAALVERLAALDSRLRLVRGSELPEGWYGKPWACCQGYRAALGDLLVFTDADTRHQPALLEHAVGLMERERADLVTLAPYQRCVTLWERLVMPQVWLLLAFRFHPDVVNHARHARDLIASGQFILTPRSSYEAVGTHAVVAGEVAEDLALAQEFWVRGRKVFFAFAERLMETRMYRGLRLMVEGWSKNIYLGGRRSFPDEPFRRALVPAALSAAMLFWLVPPAVLAGAALRWLPAGLERPGLIASLASAGFWVLVSAGMRIPVWYGLLYPLGAALSLFIILRSTWRGARKVEWKGRVYRTAVSSRPPPATPPSPRSR
jgi:chlorobactene glucosyltransferase